MSPRAIGWGILILAAGLLSLGTAADVAEKPGDGPSPRVIDMHCHTAGIGAGGSGCYVSPSMRNNWRFGVYLKAFGVTEEELREQGDGLVIQRLSEKVAESEGVDAAVVLALDGVIGEDGAVDYEATEIYVPNDFVARETARYENLLFGASVNPYRPDALARLDEAAARGATLIKWLPAIQQIDPSDERLVPFYRRMKELGLPLLTHAGHDRSFTRARHELSDPRLLELPLSIGVTVIAAHGASTGSSGGEDNMERLLAMVPDHRDLYTDISSLTQINKLGYLSRLLRNEAVRPRLLYGTDMPLINTALVSPWYHVLSLGPARASALSGIGNLWDRDLLLKRALGVPDEVFTRAAGILRIPSQ